MTMKCPECMAPLNSTDGETAYCSPQCGQKYKILFSREWETAKAQAPPPPPPKPAKPELPPGKIRTECPECRKEFTVPKDAVGKTANCPNCKGKFEIKDMSTEKCRAHPEVDAAYNCAACGAPICEICSFPQPNGSQKCSTCATASPMPMAGPAVSPGIKCVNHPEVQATFECKVCRSPICPTCDFAVPGGVHLCPKCVDVQDRKLSPKRKRVVIWSYVAAVVSTIMFIAFFVLLGGAESASDAEAIATVVGGIIIICSLVGIGLAFSAFEKRLHNPISIWVAVIWNLLLGGSYLLLAIVGTFMG